MSENWEYKTLDYKETSAWSGSLKAEPLELVLNEQGRMAWELVSAVSNPSVGGKKGLVLILKRKR